MACQEAKLARGWKKRDSLKLIPTRNGYGDGLVEAAKADPNVMVICADLTDSTRTAAFKEAFPDRFVQFGVAEQAMAAVAAGMALAGKIVFISSYAAFSPGRNWEQLRTTACLQKANVKIAGAHAGVSVGPDGATHQMIEDIAITRVLPEMKVLVPCDAIETRKATIAAAKMKGPVYVRFARSASPVFTTNTTPFAVGKAQIFRDGSDLAIIACGPLVYEALLAAEKLASHGIEARVINNVSVKPMDEKTIVQAAKECGAIVTVEEAQAAAGMGSAVCEVVCEHYPVPVERIGMQDRFGESGAPDELLKHFGLTAPHIVKIAKHVVKKKH